MRIPLLFLTVCLFSCLQAQVSGKLYIAYTQNVTGLADSIGYYLYPGGQFRTVADFSARDMAKVDDIIFVAPQPGPGGRYDSLQAISSSSDLALGKVPGNFTAGNVERWNDKLVVSCGEAPWLRVLDAMPPYTEVYNLPLLNVLNREPFGMTVYNDRAYMWTDSMFAVIDLSRRQLESVISFPSGFLVQSEFNAILGAADSAYLLLSMGRNANSRDSVSVYYINLPQRSLEFRDQYVVSGLLAFPGVGAGDIIHFSRYRAYYDPATGKIVQDMPGQTFLPGQASSYDKVSNTLVVMEEASFNRQFMWLEHGDTIINNLSPIRLPERTVIVWNTLFIDNLTLPIKPETASLIKVYPNPAKDIVHIDAPGGEQYELYTLQGARVAGGSIILGKGTIQLGGLAAGSYLCNISGRHGLQQKLILVTGD